MNVESDSKFGGPQAPHSRKRTFMISLTNQYPAMRAWGAFGAQDPNLRSFSPALPAAL